ncbi:hypothetical protein E3N88_09392 [Mikania micrantha]|uniref:Disease resistance protein Roq1-like winged-helix domain-containing protein n=1 Tax=Mikania micrantha TaxID=192012 RepID=A0A5N6PL53_9ASTR|nr:hypothetical protein E3N88_09392 [Mikania micrantha]
MFGCFFIGKDMDYVIKILDPDYSVVSGIKTLIDRCLLSITSNKKLMMHRLLQEMGRNIARQESVKFPARRSRIWLSSDSYKILSKGNGSKSIEGLALDMKMLLEQTSFKLKFVELDGSYEYFSEDLRWLCWHGFHLRRKTGRPKQVNPSFTELKTLRCIIDGPELRTIRCLGIRVAPATVEVVSRPIAHTLTRR